MFTDATESTLKDANSEKDFGKKKLTRKFQRTVEKLFKFARRNRSLSQLQKSTSSESIMPYRIGSTNEFCDQVGCLRIIKLYFYPEIFLRSTLSINRRNVMT